MNDLSDQQLLREYSEFRREAAFAELVRRHVDLVYSAALRLLHDAHLAQDVTQAVFAAVAENAPRLARHPVLSGWLHCTTRNLASNAIRSDARRRVREQEAVAMNELLSSQPDHSWETIAPHLDSALGELNDADREALMLRYFEKKSAGEMAVILGITNEAAQKRVNRAVDRLRGRFAKRGVTIAAGGLVVIITANAVQVAPAALAGTLASAVLAGTAATSTTLAIAMTTLQKIILGGALAAAVGTGIYQARQAAQLRQQNLNLRQQQGPLLEANLELQNKLAVASNRLENLQAANSQGQAHSNYSELLKLRGEVSRLRGEIESTSDTGTSAARLKSWLDREQMLKQAVKQNPDKAIPEFSLLSEEDWLGQARNANLSSDDEVRHTLANLRYSAENTFVSMAANALGKYAAANNGAFPTSLSAMLPFFETPVDAAILQRWQIVPQSTLPLQHMDGEYIITEKAPVDADLDQRWAIGRSGYGNTGNNSWDNDFNSAMATVQPVLKAYAADNNGQDPSDPSQLLPYLTTPELQAAYQKLMQKYGTNSTAH